MEKWLVTVKTLKSAVMVFRLSHVAHASISLSINGELIKQVTVHRHLGLQLDECLTRSAHAAHVICKLSQRIGLLHRLRCRLPPPAIPDIYSSTLLPVADYACIVSGAGLRKGDCAKLEKVHRRAARLISGTKLADNISHDLVLARAGLSPLSLSNASSVWHSLLRGFQRALSLGICWTPQTIGLLHLLFALDLFSTLWLSACLRQRKPS